MTWESGPFLTMVTLGVAGLSAFPGQILVGSILSLAVEILIGNLDREMRDFLGRAAPTMIPFFAFARGSSLDLGRIWQAGLLGLAMGLAIVAVSAAVLQGDDRFSGGNGTAGMAVATTADDAAAVPALVAAANPVYAPAAGQATVLVAACVVVTSISMLLLTAGWARCVGTPDRLRPSAAA